MTHLPEAERGDHCLNCGAALHGPFCSGCGQRVLPPYPTLREMAGDSWEELSGYDGRFMRTFRMLLRHPGALTREVLEGRRARYVAPVRLYLVASVFYFLVAAAAPHLIAPISATLPGSGVTISMGDRSDTQFTPEQRQLALDRLHRAPPLIRQALRAIVMDPIGFRNRFRANFPRTLFVLLPVFAGIVSIFFRRRRFSQHLVFALHLHTAIFITLAVRELTNFIGSVAVAWVFQIVTLVLVCGYSLAAFRTVYEESWPRTVVKAAGVAVVYVFAGVAAMLVTFAWTVVAATPRAS